MPRGGSGLAWRLPGTSGRFGCQDKLKLDNFPQSTCSQKVPDAVGDLWGLSCAFVRGSAICNGRRAIQLVMDPRGERNSCLFCDLELKWATRFLLHDDRPGGHLSGMEDIMYSQGDQVTTAQFAVNRQIEQR